MKVTASLEALPPAPPASLAQRVTYWRYLAVWTAAAQLPDRVASRLPERIGRLWFRMASVTQREQVRRNIRRVAPDASASELGELVRSSYISYARYWLDSFRLHTMDGPSVVAGTPGEGLHHIDAVRDSGRGGLFATGHLGSWDVGALFTAQRRWGMVAVAEVVEPRRLFERFVLLREQAGIDIIPLVKGGDMLDQLEKRVTQEGQLATLLADRDLSGKGPIVSFFGEPCRLPPGTAVLARRTGRLVSVGAFYTEGTGFRGVVQAPIDISKMDVHDGTQAIAHELERLIRRAPEQWHVFVRNWLIDREPHHPVTVAWRAGEDWQALARSERVMDADQGRA